MMTGVAFAQGTSETSTTTRSTTATAPGVEGYHSSETRRDNDRYGDEVHTKKIDHHDVGGSTAITRTRTISPDASTRTTSREKETGSPNGGSITEKTTTTTLDR
jgi:hypothetical protein